MTSKPPQSSCPHCGTPSARLDLLSEQYMHVDYFRCLHCHHVWKVAIELTPRRAS